MTDVERLERSFMDAMATDRFERIGNRRGIYDVSLDCDNPVPVTKVARATGLAKNLRVPGYRPHMIEMIYMTPCRRCAVCLRREASRWRARAINEIGQASRTWFGTLTCTPERHHAVDIVCSTRKRDFWMLSPDKKFAEQTKVVGKEVTDFLKRVRKNSGQRFRYLLVCERHASDRTSDEMYGRPHFHILLHEYDNMPVRKALLEQCWKWGFSSWKLTDSGGAFYVAKYISKAMDVRTRASIGYGNSIIEMVTE